MSEVRRDPVSPVSQTEHDEINRLISYVEAEVPADYRAVVLDYLLRFRSPRAAISVPARQHERTAVQATGGHSADRHSIDLSIYDSLLSRRGEPLLKSLAALHASETQLRVRWMTPAEITFFLRDIAGVTTAYRSNISNALRREPALVVRRRRGRGYEYGLTPRGHSYLERRLRLVDADGG